MINVQPTLEGCVRATVIRLEVEQPDAEMIAHNVGVDVTDKSDYLRTWVFKVVNQALKELGGEFQEVDFSKKGQNETAVTP